MTLVERAQRNGPVGQRPTGALTGDRPDAGLHVSDGSQSRHLHHRRAPGRAYVGRLDGRRDRIAAGARAGRPLVDVLPDIEPRGFLAVLQSVLARGTVEVLAPALHHYLFTCAPSEPSTGFDRMQQHVTIGPLREDGRIVGLIVTIEDVTARIDHERQAVAMHRRTRLAAAATAAHDDVDVESLTRLLGDDDWRVRREGGGDARRSVATRSSSRWSAPCVSSTTT